MRFLIYLLITSFFCIACKSQTKETTKYKIEKNASEWRDILSAEQFYILRESGTERAFTGKYNKHYKAGIYYCAGCNNPLYKSDHKFDSGTGWPSFDRAIPKSVLTGVDYKLGYARNELKCSNCGGHLGHVFGDGPKETTGQRHCINSAALNFKNQTHE